jgi:hypothetical protein
MAKRYSRNGKTEKCKKEKASSKHDCIYPKIKTAKKSTYKKRTSLSQSIFGVGNRLNEVVEQNYQSEGYKTQRNRIMVGKTGRAHKVDILAEKENLTLAIECSKNSHPTSLENLTEFHKKIQDLKLQGVFAAYSGFTKKASQIAQSQNIETIDNVGLMEKWWALSLGATESNKAQTDTFDNALPVKVNFDKAIKTELLNSNKITVSKTELIFHPYYSIGFKFKGQFKDPNKKTHQFKDKKILLIDALDKTILNQQTQKSKILDPFGSLSSNQHGINKAKQDYLTEIQSAGRPTKYTITVENEYKITKLKPIINPQEAIDEAITFATKRNTHEIKYTPKKEKGKLFHSSTSTFYIPERKDFKITSIGLIHVPRWVIQYRIQNSTYTREIFAYSGSILRDTMRYCPKHLKTGLLKPTQKKAIAVCEVCGLNLCENHIKKCLNCEKWLCSEHGEECNVCSNRFCNEHQIEKCSICKQNVCPSCSTKCPICKKTYCTNHTEICDLCGVSACPDCITVSGLIKKTRKCKNCYQG